EVDELDLDLLTVKIAVEIEKEYLKDGRAVIERGPGAKVCRAVVALTVHIDTDGIDAVRQCRALGQGDVRGRETQSGSPLGTAGYRPDDPPPMSKIMSR